MAENGVARIEGANGQIELAEGTVTIARKGLRGSLGHGKEAREVRFSDILRVDFEEPTFTRKGYIRFAVPGEIDNDVVQDKHCVLFTKKQASEFIALRDHVKSALANRTDEERRVLSERNSAAYKQKRSESAAVSLDGSATAVYAGHSAQGDVYIYPAPGGTKFKTLKGARANFESGSDKSRPTITRIGAGAIIAGPTGAVIGGLIKKNTTRCYVTTEFLDGEAAIVEGPAKDEAKMRQFAADVNRLAAEAAK